MNWQDIPKTWPTDIPFDPARKRYYRPDPDPTRNPSDFDLLNEEEVFIMTEPDPADGRRYPIQAGAREIQIPGRSHPEAYGLPRTRARPSLFVGRRNKLLDAYGFDHIFVSTRAKELLHGIDAEAFEFLECETRSRRGVEVEPYWMAGVIRPVEGFDEQRSVFELSKGINGSTKEPYEGPYFSSLYDIRMQPDLDERFHAFFFPRYPGRMIFDHVLADEWRAHRFSGWMLTPLQPPAPRERRSFSMGLDNFTYWYRGKYRNPADGGR